MEQRWRSDEALDHQTLPQTTNSEHAQYQARAPFHPSPAFGPQCA